MKMNPESRAAPTSPNAVVVTEYTEADISFRIMIDSREILWEKKQRTAMFAICFISSMDGFSCFFSLYCVARKSSAVPVRVRIITFVMKKYEKLSTTYLFLA